MKHGKSPIFYLSVLTFIAVIIGLYWLTKPTNTQLPADSISQENNVQNKNNVRISYEPISQQTPTPADETPESERGAASNPLISGKVDSVTTDNAVSSDSQSIALKCRIVDVIGTPIERGTLTINDGVYPFKDGAFDLENCTENRVCIAARADGYRAATKTVELQKVNLVDFQLDYYCDFKILVSDDSGPVNGADVEIYQAKVCERPIKNKFSIQLCNMAGQFFPCKVSAGEDELKITNATYNYPRYFSSSNTKRKGVLTPRIGDVLMGLGDCMLLKTLPKNIGRLHRFLPIDNNVSQHARILDTLSVGSNSGRAFGYSVNAFVQQNGKLGFSSLKFPSFTKREPPVASLKTDLEGACRIKNLSPGLYFARARKDERLSVALPLHPACGGAKLTLKSNCSLCVHAMLKGVPGDRYTAKEFINNVQLTVRSNDEKSAGYFSNTTNLIGISYFHELPFGKYTISAVPPKELGLSTMKLDVELTNPKHTAELLFDGWEKHSIVGEVVRIDTLDPIRDIDVKLLELCNGGYQSCDAVRSDVEGKFRFDCLARGSYKIALPQSDYENIQYYPYSDGTIDSRPPEERPFIGRNGWESNFDYETHTVTITDEPVYPVQVKMIPCVSTRFSGKVTYSDSRPAKGALLQVRPFEGSTIRCISTATVPQDPQTDDNGFFDFTLVTKATPSYDAVKYNGEIFARIVERIPAVWNETTIYGEVYERRASKEEIITRQNGTQRIRFQLGETVDNLQIVIDGDDVVSFEGCVLTEDGQIVDNYKVGLSQHGKHIWGRNGENGRFSFEGVEMYPFAILVSDAFQTQDNASVVYFEDECVSFTADQIRELLKSSDADKKCTIDIVMKPSGYFSGKVVDADRNPVSNACVQTDPYIGKAKWAFTDETGNFLIQGLSLGKEYSLYIGLNQLEVKQYISNLTPSLDNILIQLD